MSNWPSSPANVIRATGVLMGCVTRLNPEVACVLNIVAGGVLLQEMQSCYEFPDDTTLGKPTMYAHHRDKVYVWPIPVTPVRVDMQFVAGSPVWPSVPMIPPPPPAWLELYRAEYNRAKTACQ